MRRRPICAEEIQEAAVKCRFCGEILSAGEAPLLPQVADAEIKLKTLLLNAPEYARQFFRIGRAPSGYFRTLDYGGKDSFKQAVAFMLQGVTLGFVILTAGWTMPESIAGFAATHVILISGSRENLADYSKRVQEVQDALPSALAKEWLNQGELMLAVRILPENRFQRMLQRLRELSAKAPDLLEQAIKGTLMFGPRFGGRHYILSFFMGLDPRMGPLLQKTRQVLEIGPKYELKPHVDFLVRTMVLWTLTCWIVSRLIPAPLHDGAKSVFVIGAYLVGFLEPVMQFCRALINVYLAVVLPPYVIKASQILMDPAGSDLGAITSGVFPFENLALWVVNNAVPLAAVGIAMASLAGGVRKAYRVSKRRAWLATGVGLSVGLGLAEGAQRLVVQLLAPTGLL